MTVATKALWVIERNLAEPLTLDRIAEACGVSRFHLAHAFGASTGRSVMQYVRCRRLSEAAAALAAGRPDILDLALEFGYGSHEAFSRAFRNEFGATPEGVRRAASLEGLTMTEPMKIAESGGAAIEPPRYVAAPPMLLIGLTGRHGLGKTEGIAGQWQRFMAEFYGGIPHRTASIPVGVSMNFDDDGNFDYLCAAEVAKFAETPKGLAALRIPAQGYAVFTHREHMASVGATYAAIWNRWFPSQPRRPAEGPILERHLPSFDPGTGLGGVEIWIPVEEAA